MQSAPFERKKSAELQMYLDIYPGAQIGVSDDQHYGDYGYHVSSVFHGNGLKTDYGAWMDLAYGGIDEKYISRFLYGCNIPTWILPLGAPFTMINYYTDAPMFSEEFRRVFKENYKLAQEGNTFQVWRCQDNVSRVK
jgi:hypothetical protein